MYVLPKNSVFWGRERSASVVVGMLTIVITQLWSFDIFCGRFKINVMDGQGLGCWCLSKPCSQLLRELPVRSALALSPDLVCSDYP